MARNHSHTGKLRPSGVFMPVLLGLLAASPVNAAIFRVGAGGAAGGCTHSTLQAAVDAASVSPGADIILVARNQTWTAQELLVDTSQELTIEGGYDNCNSNSPSGSTELSGQGGNARPVIRIYGRNGSIIRLRRLTITRGDNGTGGDGGGLYYEGNGRLEISNSTFSQNVAGYGAGMYLRGTGPNARVDLGEGVIVSNNTARYSGGGIYVNEVPAVYFGSLASAIFFNRAEGLNNSGGYGGGVMVLGRGGRNVHMTITGGNFLSGIFSNTAVYGGGIAVVGDGGGDSETTISVLLQAHDDAPHLSISNNIATSRGGALYARSSKSLGDSPIRAHVYLMKTEIVSNTAPQGAAIYAQRETDLLGNGPGPRVIVEQEGDAAAAPCATGSPCSRILGNSAVDANNQPSGGSIIHVESSGGFFAGRNDAISRGVIIQGNKGGRLVHAGDDAVISLANALVSGNEMSQVLIQKGGGNPLTIDDSTIAGNTIGAAAVLQLGNSLLQLRRSILWQPGKTSLQCSGCARNLSYVIASERQSLDGGSGPNVIVADPRFVDPEGGDFRPQAASPAVDVMPPAIGNPLDVVGLSRSIDLPVVYDSAGPRDIGAYERQTVQPLVLNGDFDTSIRLWTPLVNGISFVNDTNAAGSGNSGALYVNQPNITGQKVHVAYQCIYLPGPGTYRLNGWGHSGPGSILSGRDATWLTWELRYDSGGTCWYGQPDASGEHFLTATPTWTRPAQPTVIELSPDDWTPDSSLTVLLTMEDRAGIIAPPNGTVTGWFDGITLQLSADGDLIFANGFDNQ